jgi:hypothetical protein
MKNCLVLISFLVLSISFDSCSSKPPEEITLPAKKDITDFLGQWTFDIEDGSVGWIEVRLEGGYLDASLLWASGSVLPVSNVFLASDSLLVIQRTNEIVRMRDEKNNPLSKGMITNWLELKVNGDKLDGVLLTPRRNGMGVDSVTISGKRLPPIEPAPNMEIIKFGRPVTLFNGKNLSGWKLINEKTANGFKVVNGVMVNDPVQAGTKRVRYGNLRTEKEFEDFNLKLEVNVPRGSNSGIYLRGMYEIQVMDSYKKALDPHNMGALYSRITPTISAEKPAGTWQSFDITLCRRYLTVILNGKKIIDNKPVYGPTGGAMKSDVFAKGPIYLQGDHGKVSYRNIVLTPIVYKK